MTPLAACIELTVTDSLPHPAAKEFTRAKFAGQAGEFCLDVKYPKEVVERYHEKTAVNGRGQGERVQSQALLEMAQREDQSEQGTSEQFPVEQAPNLSPAEDRIPHKGVRFGNAQAKHVIGKHAVKDLQQEIELEL